MPREEDQILDPSFLDDIGTVAMSDLRSRRDRCLEIESELSYTRRLLQGKLDILKHEAERRAEGGDSGLAALIEDLPAILADEGGEGGGLLRHTEVALPRQSDLRRREVEQLASEDVLSRLDVLSSSELTALVEKLTEAEANTSRDRRRVQEVCDALNSEFVKRYRDGDESVDELLSNQF